MEGLVSQRLTQYFECLLDVPTTNKNIKKNSHNKDKNMPINTNGNVFEVTESQSKKKKKKKQKKIKTIDQKNENIPLDNESNIEKNTKSTKKNNITNMSEAKPKKVRFSQDVIEAEEKTFTDDGFKIVSSIPEDDSDVSDAFDENCSEEEEDPTPTPTPTPCLRGERNTSRKPKETEDGFKIVTEIPQDDSDVSDAFEGDEDELVSMSSLPDQQKPIKKPIMQIMSDFGIDKILAGKREDAPKQPVKLSKKQKKMKNRQTSMVTQAAKRKNQGNVQIIDYAKKRGVNKDKKPKVEEEEEVQEASMESKPEALDEKQLKRVRYDVFKLGMSGFHKEKKEDTRVALAIKLGAKPPRNKGVNYKKLQELKKGERKMEAEEKEMKLKLGLKVPKPFKKKDRPVVKAAASQIGRYKHGVQVLSKRDLSKITKS